MTSPMALLPKLGVKEKWCRLLPTLLSHGHTYTESHLDEVLDRHLPIYGSTLRTAFDDLFGQTSGYQQLDERLARTRAKKDALRMVLDHPEILLHNNPAELGARQRVRKRDVSAAAHAPEKASA